MEVNVGCGEMLTLSLATWIQSRLACASRRGGTLWLVSPISLIKMLVVHGSFGSFLPQSCLKKKTNWENSSDPKASKIKPEQGR